jgi:hypothetical protein
VTLGIAQLQSASGKPAVSQIDFGTFSSLRGVASVGVSRGSEVQITGHGVLLDAAGRERVHKRIVVTGRLDGQRFKIESWQEPLQSVPRS